MASNEGISRGLSLGALALAITYPAAVWAQTGAAPPPAAAGAATETATTTSDGAPQAASPLAAAAPGGAEDIIVTARRQAEDIQRVPVAVTALGSDQLRSSGIVKIADIAHVVTGINLFFAGNEHNPIYSIRGLSRGSLGFQQPAVTTYVNDVPTTLYDSALPTYDIANIQVLKGPQGTLFGRNSEAGAMLVTTVQPTYTFNGFLEGTVGSYFWHRVDGAVNIPIIDGHLAVRVAGDFNRRDGYTKNLTFPGDDFANSHNQSFRVSVLAEPIDGVKNVTIFEKTDSRTNGIAPSLISYDPNAQGLPNVVPGALGIGPAFQQQQANGPRTAVVPFPLPEVFHATAVTNTTTVDIGAITIKNVFGYRQTDTTNFVNPSGYTFPLISGYTAAKYKQYTDELQLSGKTMNGNLNYILGAFYLNYQPNGNNFIIVAPPGTGAGTTSPTALLNSPFGSDAYYRDISKSVFGQVNYALSGLSSALTGLSIDAGVRYSSDIHKVCSVSNTSAVAQVSEPDCQLTPGNNLRVKQSQWSYTVGLNYQIDTSTLVYAVTRRGYRAGGLNAPTFGGTLAPFQAYQPETVHDVELGVKTRFEAGLVPVTFNAAVFQANYANLQGAINTNGIDAVLSTPPFAGGVDGDGNPGNNPTIFYANIGKARVRGIEATLGVRPFPALRLNGGLSYLDKKITSNTFSAPPNWPAFLIPPTSSFASTVFFGAPGFAYNGSVDYTAPIPAGWGDLIAHANVSGSNTIRYDAIVVRPKAVLDLRLDWNSVMQSNFDVSLFVTNVTNKLYIAAPALGTVGAFAFTSGIYNEPRIFGVQARVRFGAH